MLNKNLKIFFALIILILSGLLLFFLTKNNGEKIFVVLPHHNLVDSETDKFYANLKEKYSDFENIVLISPNHFGIENNVGFPEKAIFCYKKNCVNGENLDFLEKSEKIFNLIPNPSTLGVEGNYKKYFLEEHGIGNHFKFFEKYFSDAKVFSLILKINTNFTENNKQIFEKLKNHKFSGKTLFVASVDFSHHTNEKSAIFHDLKTYKFLTSGENYDVEVDCPNCLHFIKNLAYNSEKKYFNLSNRTSVDTFLNLNSNFENTTHFYGEFLASPLALLLGSRGEKENNFQKIPHPNLLLQEKEEENEKLKNFEINLEGQNKSFEKSLVILNLIQELENKNKTLKNSEKQKIFTFSYFPDFINLEEKNFSKNTKCFYSNKDFKKNPVFWFNRILYSFDLNILDYKNAGNFDENKKEELQKVGFNYFGQETFENKDFFLINLKNSEIEKYLKKIKQKKSENKKIIVFVKELNQNLRNILVKEKIDFVFVPHPNLLLGEEKEQKINFEGLENVGKAGLHSLQEGNMNFEDSEINNLIPSPSPKGEGSQKNFEKISETNIFYTKGKQAIFGAVFGENIYFEMMNFKIKDGVLDCESFN